MDFNKKNLLGFAVKCNFSSIYRSLSLLRRFQLYAVLLFLLLPFSTSFAQEASLSGSVITIPVVAVGDTFYKVELTIIPGTDPIQFDVTGGEPISVASSEGATTLSGITLSIPALRVGADTYNLQLSLVNSSPFQFELVNFGLNESNVASEEIRQLALELFELELETDVVQFRCIACHVDGGLARDTNLIFERNHVASSLNNFDTFASFLETTDDGANYILSKVNGGNHVGGIQLAQGSSDYNVLAEFLDTLERSNDIGASTVYANDFFIGVTLGSPEETLREPPL